MTLLLFLFFTLQAEWQKLGQRCIFSYWILSNKSAVMYLTDSTLWQVSTICLTLVSLSIVVLRLRTDLKQKTCPKRESITASWMCGSRQLNYLIPAVMTYWHIVSFWQGSWREVSNTTASRNSFVFYVKGPNLLQYLCSGEKCIYSKARNLHQNRWTWQNYS